MGKSQLNFGYRKKNSSINIKCKVNSMKIKIMLIVVLLVAFTGCAKQSENNKISAENNKLSGNLENDIVKFFPTGKVDVDVMQFSVAQENKKRYDEIVDKIISNYEANKAAFKDSNVWKLDERIYKMRDGIIYANHIVNWDEHFGISYEEYEELIEMVDFSKISKGVVEIERDNKNILTIKPIKNVSNLNSIKINILEKTMSTTFGNYKFYNYREPENNLGKTVADRWRFYQWIRDTEKASPDKANQYNSFLVGQIEKTNEIVIFLRNDYNDSPEHYNVIFSFKPKVKEKP